MQDQQLQALVYEFNRFVQYPSQEALDNFYTLAQQLIKTDAISNGNVNYDQILG